MKYQIYVVPQTLTDGSKVYDVKLGNWTLYGITKHDADVCALGIAALINDHTTDDAAVFDD
jgi:hypothetical protein